MENCVAPGLDKFQSIIRSCIVFGQSIKGLAKLDSYCSDKLVFMLSYTIVFSRDSEISIPSSFRV